MRRRAITIGSLLTATALAAAIGGLATPAIAGTASFNVANPSNDGSFTATAGTTTLTDTSTGAAVSCASSTAPGIMHTATGLATSSELNNQNLAGGVSGGSYSGCTGPGGASFTVDGSSQAWSIFATSYDSSTDQMAVDLYIPSDFPVNVSGPSCSYSLTGTLTGTYANSSSTLAVSGGSLTVSGASGNGCSGLAADGDAVTFAASYSVTPAVTMSPDPVTLGGDWAPFTRCPVEDSSMLTADGETNIASCVASDSPSGSIKIGNSTATTGDTNLQFGLIYSPPSGTYSYASPSGGALIAAPVQIPGGLLGLMCPSSIPVVSQLCQEATDNSLNNVTAQVESVGNPSNFSIDAGLSAGQPIVTLQVVIQLQNPLLGSDCYLGTDSDPIVLHPENLTAPTLSGQNFDPNGTPDSSGAMFGYSLTGANQGDSTFAVPGASGCGPLGVADDAINLKDGLPSPSGNNDLVLNNAVTSIAGFNSPSSQYPNEGANLAAAWNSAVQS
jgi:hypothetical protein